MLEYISAMGKNIITAGTVLSVKPLGENNASVCFFLQDNTIVYAVMYGGPKSRFKSLASPWNSGTVYLSESPKSKNYKLSDFDVKKYHLSFRENLTKSWSASLAAELLIRTKCAGNAPSCWKIFNGFIDGLELCATDEQCTLGLFRFLWRFLELLGVQPDASHCSRCGMYFLTGKNTVDTVSYTTSGAAYNAVENSFICAGCGTGQGLFLSAEAMRYLAAVSTLTPKESRLMSLSSEAAGQLKQFLFYLVENACGSHLTCLEAGTGIL